MHLTTFKFNVAGANCWLKTLCRATLWMVAFITLAIRAQTPRQMEQQQIVKRGNASMVAIQATVPRPLDPVQTVKRGPAGMVAVHAQAPQQTLHTPVFLSYDQTDNAFELSPYLPADLRRVAVLPLAWEGSQIDLSQGCETLGPVLLAELIKTKKFEAVSVSPEDLRSQTGRLNWTGAEILPADFLDSLQRVYGCHAVLFCQLTVFRAYTPLAVGWRMKLVDVRTGQILWAVDKIFDAEQPKVLKQARRYHFGGPWFAHDSSNDQQVENSPRQFGQYTITQVLSTLPNRKEMTKVSLSATDVPSKRQTDKKLPVTKEIYGN